MHDQKTTRLKRLSRSAAVDAGISYYFNEDRAAHAVEFFEAFLRHSKGRWAGQPFTLLEWQRTDVIEELFGWLRIEDDTRRFRHAYISTPKKQGKSTLLAGIGLYLLCADGEAAAEVYGAAADREQASICYREAAAMVRASPFLSRRLEVIDSRRTIASVSTGSFYRCLPGSDFRVEGLNIHGLLFDELHAQRSRALFDSLRYGGASRTQSLQVAITTAGYDRNSIAYEQYQYATRVLADWTTDPAFFAYVRQATLDDDWTKPDAWKKACPSYGITVTEADFAADAREAQLSVAKQNAFLRYRLNCWVQQDTRWLSPDLWAACNADPIKPLDGREAWCGLDLASTTDVSAFVAAFPGDDGGVDVVCKFWIPDEALEDRERRDRVPWSQWIREGRVTATSGSATDYDVIRRDIVEFSKRHNIKRLAVDRWNATQLANQLMGDGLDVVAYPQNFQGMNSPCRLLETLMESKRLRHGGNPVLNWMANNVAVRTNSEGHIRPAKPKPGSSERIDGIVALVQALGVWSVQNQTPSRVPEIVLI